MSVSTLPALSANGHKLVLAINAAAMLPMKLLRIVIGVSGLVTKIALEIRNENRTRLPAACGMAPVGEPADLQVTALTFGAC